MKASSSRFGLSISDNRPSQSQMNTSLKRGSSGPGGATNYLNSGSSSSVSRSPAVVKNGNKSTEEGGSVAVKREGAIITDLLYKLHRRSTTLVDTHVICQDGFIPVHRCVLMACSKFLMELLIHEDPAELASISLPDYKLNQVLPFINSLYTGCTTFKKSELTSVIEIITILQADITYSFQPARDSDKKWAPKLRHYVENKGHHQQEGGTFRHNQTNLGASSSRDSLSQVSPSSSNNSSHSAPSSPLTLKLSNVRGGYMGPSKSSSYSCVGAVEEEERCSQYQELNSSVEDIVDIEEIDDPCGQVNGNGLQYESEAPEGVSEDEFEIVEIITDDNELDGQDSRDGLASAPVTTTTLSSSRRGTPLNENSNSYSNQSSRDNFEEDLVFSPTIDLVNNVIIRPDIHNLNNRDDDMDDESDERDPLELESLLTDENFEEDPLPRPVPVNQQSPIITFPGRSSFDIETITFDESGQHKQIAQIITEPSVPFSAWSASTISSSSAFKSPKAPGRKVSPRSSVKARCGDSRVGTSSSSGPPNQRQTRHSHAEQKRLEQMRVDIEQMSSKSPQVRIITPRRRRSFEKSEFESIREEELRSRKEDILFSNQLQQQIRMSLESHSIVVNQDLQESPGTPLSTSTPVPPSLNENNVYDFKDEDDVAPMSKDTSKTVEKIKEPEISEKEKAEKEALEKKKRLQEEEERLLKIHQVEEQLQIEQEIVKQRKLEERRMRMEEKKRQKLESEKLKQIEDEKRHKLGAERLRKLAEETQKEEQEKRQKIEAEKRKKAEEKQKAIEEEKRLKLEEEKRLKLEEEKRAKLEEEKRLKQEEEKRVKREEEKRIKLEEEKRAKLEEEKRIKLEEEKRRKLEEEKLLKAEEEKRAKLAQAKLEKEEEKRKKLEKEKKLKAEKLRKAEEEKLLRLQKAEQAKKDEAARLLKLQEEKRLEAERVIREAEEAKQRLIDEEIRAKLEAQRLIEEEEARKKKEIQDKIDAARREQERIEEAKRVEEELSLQIERDMQKARGDYESSSANIENNSSSSSSDTSLFNQEVLRRPPKSTKFYEEFVEKKRRLLEAQKAQELLAILEGDRSMGGKKTPPTTDQSASLKVNQENIAGTKMQNINQAQQQPLITSKVSHLSPTSLDVMASVASEATAMEPTEKADGKTTATAATVSISAEKPAEVEIPRESEAPVGLEEKSQAEIQKETETEVTVRAETAPAVASEADVQQHPEVAEETTIEYEEHRGDVYDVPRVDNEVILTDDFGFSTEIETVVENEVEVETECADIQEEVEVGNSVDSESPETPGPPAVGGADIPEENDEAAIPAPERTTSIVSEALGETETSTVVPTEADSSLSETEISMSEAPTQVIKLNSINITVDKDPLELDSVTETEKDREADTEKEKDADMDKEADDEAETFSEAANTDEATSAASNGPGSSKTPRRSKKKRSRKVREKHTQTKPHHTTGANANNARTSQLTVSLQKLPDSKDRGSNKQPPKQSSVIVHTAEVESKQESQPEKILITTRRKSSQSEKKIPSNKSSASAPPSAVHLLSLTAAARALSRHPKRIFTTQINGQNYDLSNPKVVISRVSKRVLKKYVRQKNNGSSRVPCPSPPHLTPAARKWTLSAHQQQHPALSRSASLNSSAMEEGLQQGKQRQSSSDEISPPHLTPQLPSSSKPRRGSAPVAAVTPVAITNFPAVSQPAYITYNDLDWYQKELKRCAHCKTKFDLHTQATTCLQSHGFRRCLICLDLMSNLDASYEQHYIKYHTVKNQRGHVACPICGKLLMIRGLPLHVTKKHLQTRLRTAGGSSSSSKRPFDIPKFAVQPTQKPQLTPHSQYQGGNFPVGGPHFYPNQQLPFSPVEPYQAYPQHPPYIASSQGLPQPQQQQLPMSVPAPESYPKVQPIVLDLKKLTQAAPRRRSVQLSETDEEEEDDLDTEAQTTEEEDGGLRSSYRINGKAGNSPNSVSVLKENSVNESSKEGRELTVAMYAFKEQQLLQQQQRGASEVTGQYSAPVIDEDMARRAFLPPNALEGSANSSPQNDAGNSNSNSSQNNGTEQQNSIVQNMSEPQYIEQVASQTITLQTQEITVSQLHIERTPLVTPEPQQLNHLQRDSQGQGQSQGQQQQQQQQQQHYSQQQQMSDLSSGHYNHHGHQQQQHQSPMKRQSYYPFADIVQPKKRLIQQYIEPPGYDYARKHLQGVYGDHNTLIPPYFNIAPPPAHYTQLDHHSSYMQSQNRSAHLGLHPQNFPPPPTHHPHSMHHGHHHSVSVSQGHHGGGHLGGGHHGNHGHGGHHAHHQQQSSSHLDSSNEFPIITPNITLDPSGSLLCELSPVNYAASPIAIHQYNSSKALSATSQDMYGNSKGGNGSNSGGQTSSQNSSQTPNRPHKSLFATPPISSQQMSGISIPGLGSGSGSSSTSGFFDDILREEEQTRRQQHHQHQQQQQAIQLWEAGQQQQQQQQQQADSQGAGTGRGSDGGRGDSGSQNDEVISMSMDYMKMSNLEPIEDALHCERCNENFFCPRLLADHTCRYGN